MNCKKVRPLFPALISGELEPREARKLEEHIAGCPDCAKDLESIRRVLDLLALPAEAPERVRTEPLILAALSSAAAPVQRFPYRAVAWAAAALVILALFLTFGVQARMEDGGLVIAIWTELPAVERLGPEEVYAISRDVVDETVEEHLAPSILALSAAIDSLNTQQNEQLQTAFTELDEKWDTRFADLSLDIRTVYLTAMNQIWQTNDVVNGVVEQLVASADLGDASFD